jgi:hypothetical protein
MSSDLRAQLKQLSEVAADHVTPLDPDHLLSRARRRRWRTAAAAALGIVVLIGGALVSQQWVSGPAGLAVRPPGVHPVVIRGPGVWHPMKAAPIPPRRTSAAVWTGRELIVWGGVDGRSASADGAAYDPIRDRWRRLPPSPLSPRSGMVAAWTGTEVLLWGGERSAASTGTTPLGDGAAYDPVSNRWRRLPPAPLEGLVDPVSTWTGSELVVIGGYRSGRDAAVQHSRRGAAYDPTGNRWRELPQAPFALQGSTVAITSREVVIWGSCLAGEFGCSRAQPGLAFDPLRNRWRRLNPAQQHDTVVADRAAAAWNGHEIVLWGGNSDFTRPGATVTFDPAGDRFTSRVTGPSANGVARLFWTGTVMLALGVDEASKGTPSRFAAYDPGADRWRTLAPIPTPWRDGNISVWTGSDLLVWGGVGQGRDRAGTIDPSGMRWHPSR